MESPEALLKHATWLRRLAANLVRGDAVDDHLHTKVALATGSRKRSRTHRRSIGGIAVPTGWTPEELLARHASQQELATLVAKLDDPFRTTILLRYAEGLALSQIARKLALASDRVRWLLCEALERLRYGLDDAHGGNRGTWLVALTAIATPYASGDR
jgi:DNA-directed RNA polymerase specialized sigma24 family protein